jgi:hypothetical protein
VPPELNFLEYPAFAVAAPAANPDRGARTTPPHVDYGNKGLITAFTLPVYLGDTFVGVWAADVPLSVLHADVRPGDEETTVIVDRSGLVIARSGDAGRGLGEKGSVHVRPLAGEGGVFPALDLGAMFAAGHGEHRVHGSVVQYRVAPYLGWMMLTVRAA